MDNTIKSAIEAFGRCEQDFYSAMSKQKLLAEALKGTQYEALALEVIGHLEASEAPYDEGINALCEKVGQGRG